MEELYRKLGMAKEDVDLAQAKKEELWEKCAPHAPTCMPCWHATALKRCLD